MLCLWSWLLLQGAVLENLSLFTTPGIGYGCLVTTITMLVIGCRGPMSLLQKCKPVGDHQAVILIGGFKRQLDIILGHIQENPFTVRMFPIGNNFINSWLTTLKDANTFY